MSACSDAGPQNTCNEGGAQWISCENHGDCPDGQVCSDRGVCICGTGADCRFGETCSDGECRCASQEMPTAPEGCTVQRNTCGDWSVDCPEPDPGTPSDGGLSDGGVGDRDDDDDGGCAAGGTGSSGWPALAIAVGLFITRRRR